MQYLQSSTMYPTDGSLFLQDGTALNNMHNGNTVPDIVLLFCFLFFFLLQFTFVKNNLTKLSPYFKYLDFYSFAYDAIIPFPCHFISVLVYLLPRDRIFCM